MMAIVGGMLLNGGVMEYRRCLVLANARPLRELQAAAWLIALLRMVDVILESDGGQWSPFL